jgi:hypothetical protein
MRLFRAQLLVRDLNPEYTLVIARGYDLSASEFPRWGR